MRPAITSHDNFKIKYYSVNKSKSTVPFPKFKRKSVTRKHSQVQKRIGNSTRNLDIPFIRFLKKLLSQKTKQTSHISVTVSKFQTFIVVISTIPQRR